MKIGMGYLEQGKKEFYGQTMLEYSQILESKKKDNESGEPMDREGLEDMMKMYPDPG